MLVYVDTSALAKRLLNEPEKAALEQYLGDAYRRGDQLISSDLLDVELARVCIRMGLDQAEADRALEDLHLVGILPEVIESAKSIRKPLKSLDAIHLGTALLLKDEAEGEDAVEQVVTYDKQMGRAAEALGFKVVTPGRS